jgi:hypothetical protein
MYSERQKYGINQCHLYFTGHAVVSLATLQVVRLIPALVRVSVG